MLSNWSQAKHREVTFGTAKANGLLSQIDLSLVAQVIAVGYSSIKQVMAFAKGYGVSFQSTFWPSPVTCDLAFRTRPVCLMCRRRP